MNVFLGYIFTFGWVFLILGITQIIKAKFKTGDELSRKIVHITVAFAFIPMLLCFGQTWHLVVPPFAFIVLNYISAKKNIFSAMERSDNEKKSYGTVYYAVSMFAMALCAVFNETFIMPYAVGLFCMAMGDGFAPCFGSIKRGNRLIFRGRTLYGCISVFVISFLVIVVVSRCFGESLQLWEMLVIALGAASLELVGVKGIDNITLPLGVFLLTFLFSLI